MINRRSFLKGSGIAVVGLTAINGFSEVFARRVEKANRPNILYIMSDDHATNAISCYGGMLKDIMPTPNIDRIAQEGVRLNSCFVSNSICTPSRAVILTGKHSHNNGVYTLHHDFDRNQQNVAKLLQKGGYNTAMIGKWHLHTEPSGFDYYNVLPGQGKYHDPFFKEKGDTWVDHNEGGKQYEGYCTDVVTDITLEWLENRKKDKPFFLMCHHKAPHGLWEYAKRHENLFDGVVIPEPESLQEDLSHRSEGSREYGRNMLNLAGRMNVTEKKKWPTGRLDTTKMDDSQKIKAAYQKYLKDYLRCIAAIDENVGRMLKYLDDEGLADDTIVIYTSDQGMFLGEHSLYDKRWMFDESLKMPFVARYPKEIKQATVNDDMITNVDFAETFLDYASLDIPKDMQGRSFRWNLAGKTPSNWPNDMYYRYWMQFEGSKVPAHYGIRTRRYKLIFYYGLPLLDKGNTAGWVTKPGWEFYDLKKDPHELKNIYGQKKYATKIKRLKKRLLNIKDRIGDGDEKYPKLMELRAKHWDWTSN
ncbi:MAG: sulfatase [Phycisphaerae bacterium]|nr:sulfatase [Phycisphaerae bacterium]